MSAIQLSRLQARFPFLRAGYRRVLGSRGSWLYRQDVVAWLYRKELRRQLPAIYRVFATFCAVQGRLWRPHILGGELVLRGLNFLARLSRQPESVELEIDGTRLFVSLRDPRMLQVPNEILRPDADSQIVRSLLRPGDSFVDVGANHGTFSIVAAGVVGPEGAVIAVEPQPTLAELVRRSLDANASGRHHVYPIACGDREGEIQLFVPCASSGSAGVFASFSGSSSHTALNVPLRRFDDAVAWRDLPGQVVLKLDVEGSELAFLRGAREFLAERRPTIMFEVNPLTLAAAGTRVQDLASELSRAGYTTFLDEDLTTPHPLGELGDDVHRNVVARP